MNQSTCSESEEYPVSWALSSRVPPAAISRLGSLPNELILEVALHLHIRDVNHLMQSSRHLYLLLCPVLHRNIPASDVLIWGASYNDVGAVLLAIKHKADINATTPQGQTALCIAAVKGFTPIVNILLEHPDMKINEHESHRRAFGDVVKKGDRLMAHHLLSKGFLVYQRRERELEQPPIASAVIRRDVHMVALLLDNNSGWKSDDMRNANSKAMLDAMERGYLTVQILELFVKWSSEIIIAKDGRRGLFGRAKIDLKYKGYDEIKAFMDHFGAPYELVEAGAEANVEVNADMSVDASIPSPPLTS